MKIDFNKPLVNYKGEEVRDPRTGTVIMIKNVVCSTLSNTTAGTKDEKLELDLIAAKIWMSGKETDITPEESVLIRRHIEPLPATTFAQIYRLLG
mgnify:CR=1 FL=1